MTQQDNKGNAFNEPPFTVYSNSCGCCGPITLSETISVSNDAIYIEKEHRCPIICCTCPAKLEHGDALLEDIAGVERRVIIWEFSSLFKANKVLGFLITIVFFCWNNYIN